MDEVKKISRRESREEIIKKLYEMDIHQEFVFDKTEDDFFNDSITEMIPVLSTIDQMIEKNLQNWKLQRLSYVDRAIIRFATYEIMYTNTPQEIAINEALNLTRKFSDEGNNKMVGFTNKVLDNIAKSFKKVG